MGLCRRENSLALQLQKVKTDLALKFSLSQESNPETENNLLSSPASRLSPPGAPLQSGIQNGGGKMQFSPFVVKEPESKLAFAMGWQHTT